MFKFGNAEMHTIFQLGNTKVQAMFQLGNVKMHAIFQLGNRVIFQLENKGKANHSGVKKCRNASHILVKQMLLVS